MARGAKFWPDGSFCLWCSPVVAFVGGRQEGCFPIGSLRSFELWAALVAARWGSLKGRRMFPSSHRGSPLTIQALTADSIYVANATVDTLISA
jgi:hypothetical protein